MKKENRRVLSFLLPALLVLLVGAALAVCLLRGGKEKTEKTEESEESNSLYCTLSVRCDNALGKTEEKAEILPEDGVIFPASRVSFMQGESVFDVLYRTLRENKIHMEFSETPLYGSTYIEGIGNLYEFDCGALSGWMYRVNGTFPNYGCSSYILSDGDVVEWVYTCDLGKDVGGEYIAEEENDEGV